MTLEPYNEPEVELQDATASGPNVRRLERARRRRDEFDDIFADDPEPSAARPRCGP